MTESKLKQIIREGIVSGLKKTLKEVYTVAETNLTLETEAVFPELADIDAGDELEYEFTVSVKYEYTPAERATYDYPGYPAACEPIAIKLDAETMLQLVRTLGVSEDEIKLTILEYISDNDLLDGIEPEEDYED